MFDTILEHPWFTLGVGLAVSVVLLQIGLQTGRKEGLWGALALAMLSGLFCYVGHIVVTEKESVETMLYETAAALERNDHDVVIRSLYSLPSTSVLTGKRLLSKFKFTTAQVTKIHDIEFSGPENARRAKAFFNVVIEGQIENQTGTYSTKVARYIEMVLYRVKDRWFVYDYNESNPMDGFKERFGADTGF